MGDVALFYRHNPESPWAFAWIGEASDFEAERFKHEMPNGEAFFLDLELLEVRQID